MEKKPARVFHVRIGDLDGRAVIIFGGKGGAGRSIEVCVPAEGWTAIDVDVRRKLAASENAAHPPIPGQWAPTHHEDAGQMKTGTTDDGRVLLIARLGLPDEVRLSMDRSTARALADSLAEEASRGDPPKTAH